MDTTAEHTDGGKDACVKDSCLLSNALVEFLTSKCGGKCNHTYVWRPHGGMKCAGTKVNVHHVGNDHANRRDNHRSAMAPPRLFDPGTGGGHGGRARPAAAAAAGRRERGGAAGCDRTRGWSMTEEEVDSALQGPAKKATSKQKPPFWLFMHTLGSNFEHSSNVRGIYLLMPF